MILEFKNELLEGELIVREGLVVSTVMFDLVDVFVFDTLSYEVAVIL
jgi:hypothetical protein